MSWGYQSTQPSGIKIYKSSKLGAGDSTQSWTTNCPGDQIMTGMSVKAGSVLDHINSIECAEPQHIPGTTRNTVNVDKGGGGGSVKTITCPPGSALRSVLGKWADNRHMGYLRPWCYPFKLNTPSTSWTATSVFGEGSNDRNSKLINDDNIFLSGLSGTYWNYIDTLNFTGKDMQKAIEAQTTTAGKMKACSDIPGYGEFNTLSKSQCDQLMETECAKNEYYGTPMCSCINSGLLKKLRQTYPTFPLCPHVYDSNCQNNGYVTSGMEKAGGECGFLNCEINLINSMVTDGATIKQKCSQTTGGGTNTQDKEEGEKNFLPLLILIIVIILIGGGGAIAYSVYKKKQLETTNI